GGQRHHARHNQSSRFHGTLLFLYSLASTQVELSFAWLVCVLSGSTWWALSRILAQRTMHQR
ncbi:MAG: hypothetical protein WA299_02030, partial [Candidatus Acidiferrum sp.]